ncbi:macrolide 2'-phosphotransferase [Streptomyces spongiicola]|uniref:Macrolide 2'-phosphotransferase n=1 Tax=Streptomyces spongiicola TaxID=1690221 RepID=A0ABN5KZ95_9ACTN|nr:macrolide 2'-phosphotransferase [Streptomyces spongiicola]AWK12262.1 macrolide 2'-phosphotransferase [Streptomyces spongiicola]
MQSDEEISGLLLESARRNGLDLRDGTATLDDTGWDFHVVRVLGRDGTPWILRRARRPGLAAAIEAESRVLGLLGPRLPVAVPQWAVAGPDLIAYPMLPGEPAASEDTRTRELHWRIDRANPPERYVDALAGLMAVLHRTELGELRGTGVPVRDPRAVREAFRTRLETGRAELGMHRSWWDTGLRWLADDRLWSPRCVFIHGDLHPGHTLVDEDGRLTGVLDWTDAEIGDPGQEFVEAARKFDPPTWDLLLKAYRDHGGPAWPGLREHVLNAIAFAPLALGVLGLERGQPRYVEMARERLGVAAG